MAGPSQTPRRRAKAARKAVRRDTENRSGKGVAEPDADDNAHAGALLPAVIPGASQREVPPPSTALALAPQAPMDAPIRKRGMMVRALALGGALAATLVFAVVGIMDKSANDTLPPVVQVTSPAITAEAIQPEAALATPTKQQVNPAKSSASAKKSALAAANTHGKRDSSPATVRPGKQDTSDKKTHPTQAAKTPKKTDFPSKVADAPKQDGMLLASKTPAAQDRYSQCLELSGFLQREQCKWQVCSGKWGQDGCPSYKKDDGEVHF